MNWPTVSSPLITSRAPSHRVDGHHFTDQRNAFVGEGGKRVRPKTRRHISGLLVVPAAGHLGLDRHGFQGVDAVDGLDQKRLILRAAIEFLVQPRAQERRDEYRQQHVAGQGHEHHHGQPDAVKKHHGDEYHREKQIQHHGNGVAGQETANVLQFAHPRHGVAHPPRLEVSQRQVK